MNKTFMANKQNVEHKWHIIDATDVILGRLSSEIVTLLRGKHKPTFTPHVDCGDYVIVINAEKIALTGKKLDDKIYYRYSGYPSGISKRSAGELLDKFPERLIEKAVKGMLPKNKLGNKLYTKLFVYAGSEHPHQAQKPEVYELKG